MSVMYGKFNTDLKVYCFLSRLGSVVIPHPVGMNARPASTYIFSDRLHVEKEHLCAPSGRIGMVINLVYPPQSYESIFRLDCTTIHLYPPISIAHYNK